MQNQDWIELLQLLPESEQPTLVLTTLTGIDLNIETILRMEPEYLVFRGRVSGQTDDGRIFFLPYRQIDFMQMNREVREIEVRKLYGERIDDLRSLTDSAIMRPGSGVLSQTIAGILPATPASPSAPVPVMTTRPSASSMPLRATPPAPQPPGVRPVNIPAAAMHPNAAMNNRPANAAENEAAPAGPRNSILERLRAQRNSAMPQKPQR